MDASMTEKRNEESLGSQESNAITGSRFGVEMTEIWLFEAKLHRGYVVMGLHTVQFFFAFLGSSLGPLVGLESC